MNLNPATTRRIKVAFIAFLAALFSFLTSFFLKSFLVEVSGLYFFLTLITLIFFVVFFVIQTFVVDEKKAVFWFSLIDGAIPATVFATFLVSGKPEFFWWALIVLIFFAVFSGLSGFKHIRNSVEIKFFSLAHKIVPKLLTGALIFLALVSYAYFFQLGNLSESQIQPIFNGILETAEPAVGFLAPGVQFDMTVNEATNAIQKGRELPEGAEILKENQDAIDLPPFIAQQFGTDASDKVAGFLQKLNETVSGDITLNSVLFEAVKGEIEDISSTMKFWLEIAAVVSIFLILKGIFFLLYIPIEFLAFLVFKLLLIADFIGISIEEVSREKIVI